MDQQRIIEPGSDEYAIVHRQWVRSGRPASFDREGSWGGARYSVHFRDDIPFFGVIAEGGPTVVDDVTGRVIQRGWRSLADKSVTLRVKEDEGGLKLSRVKDRHAVRLSMPDLQ